MISLERLPVRLVEAIKKTTGAKTWHVESTFVFLILAAVAIGRIIVTGHGWVEWVGVVAVWATFAHASVANRLEEKEGKRVAATGQAEVECYRQLSRYFYLYWCVFGTGWCYRVSFVRALASAVAEVSSGMIVLKHA